MLHISYPQAIPYFLSCYSVWESNETEFGKGERALIITQ
jgi:hypothetical protein